MESYSILEKMNQNKAEIELTLKPQARFKSYSRSIVYYTSIILLNIRLFPLWNHYQISHSLSQPLVVVLALLLLLPLLLPARSVILCGGHPFALHLPRDNAARRVVLDKGGVHGALWMRVVLRLVENIQIVTPSVEHHVVVLHRVLLSLRVFISQLQLIS